MYRTPDKILKLITNAGLRRLGCPRGLSFLISLPLWLRYCVPCHVMFGPTLGSRQTPAAVWLMLAKWALCPPTCSLPPSRISSALPLFHLGAQWPGRFQPCCGFPSWLHGGRQLNTRTHAHTHSSMPVLEMSRRRRVVAPCVPSLCLFGCLCLFVSGLVPFWALRGVFLLFLFCGVCWRF